MADQRLQSTRRKFFKPERPGGKAGFTLRAIGATGGCGAVTSIRFAPSNRGSLPNPVDAFGSSGGLRPEQRLAETRLEERPIPRWQHERVARGRDLQDHEH